MPPLLISSTLSSYKSNKIKQLIKQSFIVSQTIYISHVYSLSVRNLNLFSLFFYSISITVKGSTRESRMHLQSAMHIHMTCFRQKSNEPFLFTSWYLSHSPVVRFNQELLLSYRRDLMKIFNFQLGQLHIYGTTWYLSEAHCSKAT